MLGRATFESILGGGNDLKYIKKGYFLKSCLTDDERRHPLLEHLPYMVGRFVYTAPLFCVEPETIARNP